MGSRIWTESTVNVLMLTRIRMALESVRIPSRNRSDRPGDVRIYNYRGSIRLTASSYAKIGSAISTAADYDNELLPGSYTDSLMCFEY